MKTLFTATFEQSLNLQDDQLIKYMKKDVEQPGKKEKPILVKILAILLVSLQYGFVKFAEYGIEYPVKNSFLPKPIFNFLPISVFIIMLSIYLVIWIFTLLKRYKELKLYFSYINTVNMLIMLLITLNLMFITFFLKPLTIIGMGLLLSILVMIGYVVFRTKKRSLENVLYETKTKKDKIDKLVEKVLKLVMRYGWIVVVIVMVWKLIFPSSNEVRTDVVGFIGLVSMWVVTDIGFIVAETYLFFPYLLHGYYKYKYSEEYREWEDKTQLEWYGKKYYNKHIKGTEKEKKDEQ
ncbi:DUF4176 domain-containing protein [Enterococcus hirae]|uniref:DUF4176 domain-containing protein n=1 Tax=Enterococcus hirae TaxID=1354 RepID=UPI001A95B990|nr:DUF4176 domain-containing protein [Enterococcus hirae]MBO1087732.1 DUF4176 domain-containing protein [Enterococcus hirae]MEB7517463.1 DUF4176 domain-containing protein [Enterococcus hirae]